jgi:hypothetical protein
MDTVWVLGILLLIVGTILFFVQRAQRQRAFSLKSARSVTVAELQQLASDIASEIGGGHWRDYIKLNGMIRCDRPLTSELKQEPCVYYKMSVSREYEETVTKRDRHGNPVKETNRGSETISSNQRSVAFYLEDATGRIEVNPEGAQLDSIKALEDFQPEGAGRMIAYGGFSLVVGAPDSHRRTLGYRYRESILSINQRVLVVGMFSDHGGYLRIQKPTDSANTFLVSLKDEETLTKAADNGAQSALYGMIACLGLGALLVLFALVK